MAAAEDVFDLPEQLTYPGLVEVDLHWWLLAAAEDWFDLPEQLMFPGLVEVDLLWWLLAPAEAGCDQSEQWMIFVRWKLISIVAAGS